MNNSERNSIIIQQIIKKRNITKLVHFSDIQNHVSIYENKTGLLSIKELNKTEIKYLRNDTHRYDNQLNYISLSITDINYLLIRKFARQWDSRDWVIYDINPKILLKKKCMFYNTNAANSLFSDKSKSELRSYEAFEGMFADEVTVGSRFERFIKSRENQVGNVTTCPQAEILIHKSIDSKYIIGFKNITI